MFSALFAMFFFWLCQIVAPKSGFDRGNYLRNKELSIERSTLLLLPEISSSTLGWVPRHFIILVRMNSDICVLSSIPDSFIKIITILWASHIFPSFTYSKHLLNKVSTRET